MNIIYNQRFQSTQEKLQNALFSLLKFRRYNDISIKELCYEAGVNRSTFYAHYQDINDLMIKTEQNLSNVIKGIFKPNQEWNEEVFENLFNFLYKNKHFYYAYLNSNDQPFMEKKDFLDFFKLVDNYKIKYDYPKSEIVYHMAFFAGGLKAICKNWLQTGCKETPKQISKIITNEYRHSQNFL